MKVGELIEDTRWLPGAGYGGARPRLSVFLPTFRRGADGTFLKAATSVLEQSERSLELIIVDDASTDGTADQIDSLMRADGRVSCLRHRANIGLPAVSEYEALRRARAPYLAFAFDDFIFEVDALGRLLEAAERRHGAVVHGTVECYDRFGQLILLGAEPASCERLAFDNFIGNSGFVLPRGVVDDVGFYDPHVAAARLCDWDLWRRIVREYPIVREDVLVGRELGPLRADSLGLTYPMYFEAVQEYCNRPRNTALRPEHLERFDVWAIPPGSSACLVEHVLWTRRFLRTKAWAAGLGPESAGDAHTLLAPPGRSVAVVADMTASASLCFDGLLDRDRQRLLWVPITIGEFYLQIFLARCDAVILVRRLLDDRARQVVTLCRWMQLPLCYLIDDNLILLSADDPEVALYTTDAVTKALSDFAGVLCASRPLAEYFRALPLRPPVDEIGPVFDAVKLAKIRRLRPAPADPALRVGFIGGSFRLRDLDEQVVPALAAVAADIPLAFFSRSSPANAERLPFGTTILPFAPFFDEFLTRWGEVGLDVLVHARGDTVNLAYKASSALLVALYLGAVPIVASEPAFRDVGEAQGVLKVDGHASSWERALRRVQAAEVRRELRSRLEAFCRAHFAPERNAAALGRMLAASAPTDLLTWAWRVRQVRERQAEVLVGAHRDVRARIADLARRQGELTEREGRVTQLEEARAALEARMAQLEDEASVRGVRIAELEQDASLRAARLAQLEAEVATRAYALSVKLRRIVHAVRRLTSRSTGA